MKWGVPYGRGVDPYGPNYVRGGAVIDPMGRIMFVVEAWLPWMHAANLAMDGPAPRWELFQALDDFRHLMTLTPEIGDGSPDGRVISGT